MSKQDSIKHFIVAASGDSPNNEVLPVILYKGVAEFGDREPESVFEEAFSQHDWGNGWRNGVFPFHHYHSNAHEALGFARGSATIQLGGPDGPIVEVEAGDACVIPAGVAHCRLDDAPGLSVVGAYPPDQGPDVCVMDAETEGKAHDAHDADGLDIRLLGQDERDAVRAQITGTPLPEFDPMMGDSGPIKTLWQKA